MFAFEHENVLPDVMCMAKAMANGLPLGGIIAKKKLMEAWSSGAMAEHSEVIPFPAQPLWPL